MSREVRHLSFFTRDLTDVTEALDDLHNKLGVYLSGPENGFMHIHHPKTLEHYDEALVALWTAVDSAKEAHRLIKEGHENARVHPRIRRTITITRTEWSEEHEP